MRKKVLFTPYIALVAFYVFWAISGYGRIANYLAAICCLVLMLFDFGSKDTSLVFCKKDYIDRAALYFIGFFAFYFITSIPNMSDIVYWAGNVVAFMFVSYFPLFLYRKINRDFSLEYKCALLRVILTVWIGLVVYSVIYYIQHPGIARDAIVYQSQFDNLFIGGGYYLAYGSVVLAVFVFGILKKGLISSPRIKFGSVVFILLSSLHVVLTNSTLTMIWLLVGFGLVVLFDTKTNDDNHNKKKWIVIISAIALISIFLITRKYIGSILMDFGDYSSTSLYKKRMYELGTVIKGDVYTRHTLDRLSRPLMSFELFKESPLIGIGYRFGYVFTRMQEYGMGNHSEIVDSLAKYGLLGFLLLVGTYYNFIKSIQRKLFPKESSNWWITMLAMMAFNPFVSMPSLIAVFLIIPLISMVLSEKELLHRME